MSSTGKRLKWASLSFQPVVLEIVWNSVKWVLVELDLRRRDAPEPLYDQAIRGLPDDAFDTEEDIDRLYAELHRSRHESKQFVSLPRTDPPLF